MATDSADVFGLSGMFGGKLSGRWSDQMAPKRRSSTHRREQDHYARKAQAEGYDARSVYKLQEMDRKHRFLRPGQRVLDLGCAPGSWSRLARERIGHGGVLVGVDLQPVNGFPGEFVQGNLEELDRQVLLDLLKGPADVVLSDMAPRTTGARGADHLRQIALAEAALAVVDQGLRKGGVFVVKIFDGGEAQAYTAEMRTRFQTVKRMRPDAVKKMSREFFLVGLGYRGRPVS